MAVPVPGQSVSTSIGLWRIEGGLPLGRHRFRLEVEDGAGRRSAADEVWITVTEADLPTRPPDLRSGTPR